VLVVVLAVSCVAAPIVDIVDVISVRDGHMAAPVAMDMLVALMHLVLAGMLALVKVIVVRSVQVSIVHIVDVVSVRDRDMTAPVTMDMLMVDVFIVGCVGHRSRRLRRPIFDFILASAHARFKPHWHDHRCGRDADRQSWHATLVTAALDRCRG
jgi:hypothetical protein